MTAVWPEMLEAPQLEREDRFLNPEGSDRLSRWLRPCPETVMVSQLVPPSRSWEAEEAAAVLRLPANLLRCVWAIVHLEVEWGPRRAPEEAPAQGLGRMMSRKLAIPRHRAYSSNLHRYCGPLLALWV